MKECFWLLLLAASGFALQLEYSVTNTPGLFDLAFMPDNPAFLYGIILTGDTITMFNSSLVEVNAVVFEGYGFTSITARNSFVYATGVNVSSGSFDVLKLDENLTLLAVQTNLRVLNDPPFLLDVPTGDVLYVLADTCELDMVNATDLYIMDSSTVLADTWGCTATPGYSSMSFDQDYLYVGLTDGIMRILVTPANADTFGAGFSDYSRLDLTGVVSSVPSIAFLNGEGYFTAEYTNFNVGKFITSPFAMAGNVSSQGSIHAYSIGTYGGSLYAGIQATGLVQLASNLSETDFAAENAIAGEILLFYNGGIVYGGESPQLDFFSISGSNTPPTIVSITLQASADPIESLTTAIPISFSIYDPDGAADIASANLTVSYGSTIKEYTATLLADDSTHKTAAANITMDYFDPAASWTVTLRATDSTPSTATNTTLFTYTSLTAYTAPSALLFGSLISNTQNNPSLSNPFLFNNTGNAIFNVTITGADLAGLTTPTATIPIANAKTNTANDPGTATSLGTSAIIIANLLRQAAISVYFWLDIPQSTQPQSYHATWEVGTI